MLKVQVIGACGEGKTTVAAIIEEALRAHGISVQNNDWDVQCESNAPHLQDMRVKVLAKRTNPIVIETIQLRRSP